MAVAAAEVVIAWLVVVVVVARVIDVGTLDVAEVTTVDVAVLGDLTTDDDFEVDAVLLGKRGGVTATAYNMTCVHDEPRLYSNLGVRTAKTPPQSAKKLVP